MEQHLGTSEARADNLQCDSVGPEPRLRVLLLAYSISPVRGSEYSVGWNHVLYMSQYCDLTVLYGSAGPHMGDLEEIEEYLRDFGELPNVHFVPIRPNLAARVLNFPNRKGVLVYSFYLAYRIWHLQAARVVRRLVAAEPFDVVHYLGMIGYREPGFLWKLGKPYVWGPVGGMPTARALKGAPRPRKASAKAHLKNLVNSVQLRIGRRVARAFSRADIVIAATTENRDIIKRRFNVDAIYMPENAIPDETIAAAPLDLPAEVGRQVQLIWIGRLDYGKSPDLIMDALTRVGRKDWHIDIIGEGPLDAAVRATIAKQNLQSQVSLRGKISRPEVFDLLAQSDLHILTSLSEGNPTVIWEAMAAGVPTLTLDHCGMHDVVCDRCGVRVPISGYDETCDQIAAEIERLLIDRNALKALATSTLVCRENFLWSSRTRVWLDVYQQAIAHRVHSKNDVLTRSQ